MTVGVYARHSSKCPKSKEKNPGQWKRCKCPLWLQWNRAKEQFKKSAKTRSWEHKLVQPLTQAKWVSSWLRPLRVCWIPISLTRSKKTFILLQRWSDWVDPQGLPHRRRMHSDWDVSNDAT